jgi:hypothetical protein
VLIVGAIDTALDPDATGHSLGNILVVLASIVGSADGLLQHRSRDGASFVPRRRCQPAAIVGRRLAVSSVG